MTILQKIVKAKELPADWAKEFLDPEMQVRVEITELDEELAKAKSSLEVMRIISRRAKERGLTPEIVDEILSER
jgi:hypothetical protein